jgi:hypothetical protein
MMTVDCAREIYNSALARRDSDPTMTHTERLCWLHIGLVSFEDCGEMLTEHADAAEALADAVLEQNRRPRVIGGGMSLTSARHHRGT